MGVRGGASGVVTSPFYELQASDAVNLLDVCHCPVMPVAIEDPAIVALAPRSDLMIRDASVGSCAGAVCVGIGSVAIGSVGHDSVSFSSAQVRPHS